MSGLAEASNVEFNSDGEMHAHVWFANVWFVTTGI
jgi:hypothetical protein